MKINFLSLSFITLSVLLFTACKKDSSTTTPVTSNYSPMTVGTNWTYNYTENANAAVSYTLTVANKDTSINGKTYKVVSSSDGSANKYLTKVDSNYYRFAPYPVIGSFEELYLKDNRQVNSTWTNSVSFNYPGSPFPLVANLTYTLKEKGISYAVNGTTYSDVVHVRLDASIVLAGGSVGGGDFYYANNIGLIESSISLTLSGASFTTKTQIVSYQIK